MPTLADLFRGHYLAPGVDFASVRVHAGPAGSAADRACRALGARAFTSGQDIYFAAGALRPGTRDGLWLLAHEVAHVAQQAGYLDGAAAGAAERAADAAADALVAGRRYDFGVRRAAGRPRLVQRYMGWEHAMLGDLGPARLEAAARGERGPVGDYSDLLAELGRDPGSVSQGRLADDYPEVGTVRLPGSGLVLTLGELNMLPDYLSRPESLETAPRGFIGPLIQSVRSWNIAELDRLTGRRAGRWPLPAPPPRLLPGSLRYPLLGPLTETAEIAAVSTLGRQQGLALTERYAAVLARNAGHFAPFSWYRWHSFHRRARQLIEESAGAGGAERETLRRRGQIYAAYADHFLQDSFAAGHLVNKTLVIQWYIEWLGETGVSYPGREILEQLTVARQPRLHGPGHYDRAAARKRLSDGGAELGRTGPGLPGGRPAGVPEPPWDPQDVADEDTLQGRIAASGVDGATPAERQAAYDAYVTMLRSGTVQLAVKVAHEYLNKHSMAVAAGPLGPPFRLFGDHTLLTSPAGALRAAQAAASSRQAIAELLRDGRTAVDSWEIFDSFPGHVELDGRLVALPEWHAGPLHELCRELFSQPSTRALRGLMSTAFRQLGTPVEDLL